MTCVIITQSIDNAQSTSPWVAGGWESWTSDDVGENKPDGWTYRGHPYSVAFNRFILD